MDFSFRRKHHLGPLLAAASVVVNALLFAHPLLAETSDAGSQSLEKLDAIVQEAGGFDGFLTNEDVQAKYFAGLRSYFGDDSFSKESFDSILGQLRELNAKVPSLGNRLWETSNTGDPFKFEVLTTPADFQFESGLLDKVIRSWSGILESEANTQGKSMSREAAVAILLEQVSRADQFLAEVSGLPRKQKTIRLAEFHQALRVNRDATAAAASLLLDSFRSGPLKMAFNGSEPEKILFELERIRSAPQDFLGGLPEELRRNGTIKSLIQELLPSEKEILSSGFVKREKGNKPIEALPKAKKVTWEFKPIPRRIHGIWRGIPLVECVGGSCKHLSSLTPDRWAAAALEGSHLYFSEREGRYQGYVHEIPISVRNEIYASVDYMVHGLGASAWTETQPGELRRKRLFEILYGEQLRNKPTQWGGYVVSDGKSIKNTGAIPVLRTSGAYVLGSDLGPARDAYAIDPLESQIVGKFEPKNLAKTYADGRMIYETGAKPSRRLTLLGSAESSVDVLDDPKWVKNALSSDPSLEARVLSAFLYRDASADVAAELTKKAHLIIEAFIGGGSIHPLHGAAFKLLSEHGQDVTSGVVRWLDPNPPRSKQEFLDWVLKLTPLFGAPDEPIWIGALIAAESRLPQFYKLNPTIDELNEVRQAFHMGRALTSIEESLLREALGKVKTPEEYLKCFKGLVPTPVTGEYKDVITGLVQSTLPKLGEMQASLGTYVELGRLVCNHGWVSAQISILEQGLEFVRKPGEFTQLVGPRTSPISKSYKQELNDFVSAHADRLFELDPSIAQVMDYQKSYWVDVETIMALSDRAVARVKSADEFLKLADFTVSSPSDAYADAMDEFIARHSNSFFALKPSVKQINRLRSKTKYAQTSFKIARQASAELKSAAELEQLVTWLPRNSSDDYRSERLGFAEEMLAEYKQKRPGVFSLRRFFAELPELRQRYDSLPAPPSWLSCLRSVFLQFPQLE